MENKASHMAGYLLFDVLDLLYWATSFKCCAWSQQPFAEGQLEWADVPAKEVRDERTEKTTFAGTAKYTYDVLGQLIQENNHIYTYDRAENRTSVQTDDRRDITDCHGTVLNHYAYDAFGNRTVEEETVENRFGFAGEMLD